MAKKHKISAEEAELLEAIQETSATPTVAPEEQAAPAQPATEAAPAAEEPKTAKAEASTLDMAALSAMFIKALNASADASDAVKSVLALQKELEARLAEADAKKALLNDLAAKVQAAQDAYKLACDEVVNKDLARTRAWEAVKAAKGDTALQQLGRFLRHPLVTTQAIALANLKFEEADKAVLDAVAERDRLEDELESAREALDLERSKA